MNLRTFDNMKLLGNRELFEKKIELLMIREAFKNQTRPTGLTMRLRIFKYQADFCGVLDGFQVVTGDIQRVSGISMGFQGVFKVFQGVSRRLTLIWIVKHLNQMMMDQLTKHNPEMLSHLKIRVISPWFYTRAYFVVTTPTDDYFQIIIENFDKWWLSDWLTDWLTDEAEYWDAVVSKNIFLSFCIIKRFVIKQNVYGEIRKKIN